tara:strand:- start:145 stop:1683 length:1539 start_codon:yes stop_codon:yes gene_type:complete
MENQNNQVHAPEGLKLDFSTSPVIWKFLNDNSFVRGLLGPVGSGKSYACCAELFKRAVQQRPSPKDGIRYTRFAIVRNSYPMLKTTTLKTWLELFPESVWGNVHHSPPITHHLKLPPRGKAHGIDCEVIFLALDQPKDTRKLLSLELTAGWINEVKELPRQVVDGLSHRVGRYPSGQHGKASWHGVLMDTNAPDSDHWYYNLAEKNPPKGEFSWKFFRQPGGVIEVPKKEVPEDFPEAKGYLLSAGKWWKQNPIAENVSNLPKGYYYQILGGKNLDWIRCYAEGKYTYVQEGKPIFPEYNDETMVADLVVDKDTPIHIGLDFGLTPAGVFGQRMRSGQWHILHEVVTFDMGLERFALILKAEIQSLFPDNDIIIWGDPAGSQRDQIYEVTAFDHLKTHGLLARPCATNDFKTRREAVAMPMNRLINNKPGFLVNRKCNRLRKALSGGYHFKRIAVGNGQDRYKDTPSKDMHSHISDSLQYCLMGGGEMRRMTRLSNVNFKQTIANMDFDVFS